MCWHRKKRHRLDAPAEARLVNIEFYLWDKTHENYKEIETIL